MKSDKRIRSLQALRGIAFLAIFLKHTGIELFCALGDWGVSIFFILSGFLMMIRYIDVDLRGGVRFGIKKISKLLPLYYVMLIVSIPYFISALVKANDGVISGILQLTSNVLLIQSWIPIEKYYFSLNGISWFLSDMLFIYSIFPFVKDKIKTSKCNNVLISIFIVYFIQVFVSFLVSRINIVHSVFPDFQCWATYISPVYRLGDFIIGCFIGYLYLKREENKKSDFKRYSIIECEIVLLILLLITVQTVCFPPAIVEKMTYLNSWWLPTIYFELSSALLIYFFAMENGFISRFFGKSVFVLIGNISSITYLIHLDCIKYVESLFKLKGFVIHGNALLIIISLPITLVCAYMWDKYFNTTICNFVNKILNKTN